MKGEAIVGKIKNIEVKITDEDDKVMIYKFGSEDHHPHLRIGYNVDYDEHWSVMETTPYYHVASHKVGFVIDY